MGGGFDLQDRLRPGDGGVRVLGHRSESAHCQPLSPVGGAHDVADATGGSVEQDFSQCLVPSAWCLSVVMAR